MSDYVILTDSSADLGADLAKDLDVNILPLSYVMEGVNYQNFPDHREMDSHAFYEKLRNGGVSTTAAVNMGQFVEAMEPILKDGKDVLILAFSSGLSASCNSARLAAQELGPKYPERKIFVVDTLCASLGQGLIVWYAVQHQRAGESIEQVRDWVEENKLHICHWFTVTDLMYLKRGGRLSAATVLLGTMLSIKPVLHVDDEGHLINVSKARGRKASLVALAEKLAETAIDPQNHRIFISHGDCLDDAKFLADEITKRTGATDFYFNEIGPVIGSHTGADVVALFFVGKER